MITGLLKDSVLNFFKHGLMPETDIDGLLSQCFSVIEDFCVKGMSLNERRLVYENLDDLRYSDEKLRQSLHARWSLIYEELVTLKMSSKDLAYPQELPQ